MTHEAAVPKVSVVLGTLNRRVYLEAAIGSIRRSVTTCPLEIIVVDGGSTDGTTEWLAAQKDIITVIQHNISIEGGVKIRKKSWGYFMNLGFKIARGQLLCMLSDDSVVHPDAIEKGVQAHTRAVSEGRNIGALAFRWRSYPEEKQYRVGYTLGNRMFVNHGLYVQSALQTVGWLEEEALKFYFADGDVCLKMADHGYEVICAEDSYVEHFELPKQSSPNLSNQHIANEWEAYCNRWSKFKDSDGTLATGYFDYKSPDAEFGNMAHIIPKTIASMLSKPQNPPGLWSRAGDIGGRIVRKLGLRRRSL